MGSGLLSSQIDNLKRRLAHRCHRFVVEGHASKNQIAKAAGLSWTLVKDIENASFNPSFKTLKALDHAIPNNWEPSVGFTDANAIPKLDVKPFQLGRGHTVGALSENTKIIMDPGAVSAADPGQIGRVQQFLEQRRGRDGVIREDPYLVDVIKGIGLKCSAHVMDLEDPDPMNFHIIRWDTMTGFQNSFDFTGLSLSVLEYDPAMRDCVTQDYLVVRETGWSHFSAVIRRFNDGETRSSLRLMVPFRSANDRNRMLSITRPFSFDA